MDIFIVLFALMLIPVMFVGAIALLFRAMQNRVVRTAVLMATAGNERPRR